MPERKKTVSHNTPFVERMFIGVARAPKAWSEYQGRKALDIYDALKFTKLTSEETKIADKTRAFINKHQKAIGWTATAFEIAVIAKIAAAGYGRLHKNSDHIVQDSQPAFPTDYVADLAPERATMKDVVSVLAMGIVPKDQSAAILEAHFAQFAAKNSIPIHLKAENTQLLFSLIGDAILGWRGIAQEFFTADFYTLCTAIFLRIASTDKEDSIDLMHQATFVLDGAFPHDPPQDDGPVQTGVDVWKSLQFFGMKDIAYHFISVFKRNAHEGTA